MARRQSRFPRSQSRPNRGWSGLIEATDTAIPAGSKVLLGSFTPTAPGIDLTILRTVGHVSVASDTVANELQLGAFGIIKVTDVALAAGIASIPGPVTNVEDDWFIFQAFGFETALHSNVGVNPDWAHMLEFDSKAKRILPGDGMALAIVAENAHATHGFDVSVGLRILAQVRGTQ